MIDIPKANPSPTNCDDVAVVSFLLIRSWHQVVELWAAGEMVLWQGRFNSRSVKSWRNPSRDAPNRSLTRRAWSIIQTSPLKAGTLMAITWDDDPYNSGFSSYIYFWRPYVTIYLENGFSMSFWYNETFGLNFYFFNFRCGRKIDKRFNLFTKEYMRKRKEKFIID